MTHTYHDRLSTLDASFLTLEDRDTPMHVGSVSLFDATPLQRRGGGLDFERIEQTVMQIFTAHRRLLQKVWWPAGGPPVWIDDPDFDPGYHFHRIALPSPGSLDDLRDLSGRILSIRLDTRRPLWEAWIVEGLEGGRFALIWKLHHCLADGVAVRDILTSYLGMAPSPEIEKPPVFSARPAPSLRELYREAAAERLDQVVQVSNRLGQALRDGPALRQTVSQVTRGVLHGASNLITSVASTPLNGTTGPDRRFDWTACKLAELRDIRKETRATVNDVALAVTCGALRSFFLRRDVRVDDLAFRVMIPVNVRSDRDAAVGNRVSSMVVPLPLAEPDPRRRLSRIVETTTRAKASGQTQATELLAAASDWAGLFMPVPLARFAAERFSANLVVTNIPGPQFPQYMGESQLLESFPVVPLSPGHGLGIALYGYNGSLYWGFNADRDRVPDLPDLVKAVDGEIEKLHRAHVPVPVRRRRPAEEPPAPKASRPRPRPRVKSARKRTQASAP